MKISPININNNQTLIPKKQQNIQTGLNIELPNYAQTNPVYFSGFLSSSKDLLFNKEIKQKLQEHKIVLDETNAEITTPKRMVLEKFFSDERIYKNEHLKSRVNEILWNARTKEQAEYKIKALDIYLAHEKEIKDNLLTNIYIEGLSNLNDDIQLDIMDFAFSSEEMYKKNMSRDKSASVFYLQHFQYIEEGPQAELFKAILSDEKFYSNLSVSHACPYLFRDARSYLQVDLKKRLMKRYADEEELHKSKEISDRIGWIITSVKNSHRYDLYNKVFDNKDLHKKFNDFSHIIDNIEYSDQHIFLDYVLSEEKLYNSPYLYEYADMALNVESEIQAKNKIKLLKRLNEDDFTEKFPTVNIDSWKKKFVTSVRPYSDTDSKITVIDKICSDEKLYKNNNILHYMVNLVDYTNSPENADNITKIIDIYLQNKDLHNNKILNDKLGDILCHLTAKDETRFAETILNNENFYKNNNFMKFFPDALRSIHSSGYSESKMKILDKVLGDKKFLNNKNIINNLSKLIYNAQFGFHFEMINNVLEDKKLYTRRHFMNNLPSIIYLIDDDIKYEFACELFNDKKLIKDKKFMKEVGNIISHVEPKNRSYTKMLIDEYKKGELDADQIAFIVASSDNFTYEQIKKTNNIIGKDKLKELTEEDEIIAYKFVDIYQKQNINEITTDGKKHLLKSLISLNSNLFDSADEPSKLYEFFPLLPKNTQEYCSLLKNIVTSMGIETNEINLEQANTFNKATVSLGNILSELSDKDFNDLQIEQEYSKEQFIRDVYELVKDLDKNERQKVYDYFGFELHHNKNGVIVDKKGTGFSITNYPANLNNGKKLSKIENEQTKLIIEQLRPLVINFSENNKIISNNKKVETTLNEIVSILPEIRPLIGKKQHKIHDFDVFKHSLKVMQKCVQNNRFRDLNESDKKILLIASLLHDCTKAEGKVDVTHAYESAFDTYYISKKLNLTKDEEIKLYSLIKNHDWFKTLQNGIDGTKNQERMYESVAYDLHYGNLFNLSTIFTEADLMAVKDCNDFYYEKALSYLNILGKINEKIFELKKSQPLLPVTKIPTSSRIKEAITTINPDGSTNIKGVYQDSDGLIILKYNEIEEWEKIGFPKGAISKGIKTTVSNGENVDTGNIKFFVHGLDEEKDLRKFDAFALPDSDALLSVSYAERPESKYRFFRNQGVIVHSDAKYIHGGGQTDRGSGCNKTINDFKTKYAFKNGERHDDRLFVSELIKESLNLTDKEYAYLIEKNLNKPINEIEPKEYQEKIVKALATINSNTRTGNRSYNEMYLSNPEVMGVFAYSARDWNISKPIEFVANKPAYLKNYALEKDIPFMLFGD